MGALHYVTDNHMHIYTARTSGEIKDMRHPLRLRTSTRGFDAIYEGAVEALEWMIAQRLLVPGSSSRHVVRRRNISASHASQHSLRVPRKT